VALGSFSSAEAGMMACGHLAKQWIPATALETDEQRRCRGEVPGEMQ
jgi:hypothetical protein